MKFFIIVTSKFNLRLPEKFVNKRGAKLPGTMSLIIPTGATWRVEIKKHENGILFGKGLFEFTESLGVKYGYFLMFDYVDVFDVVVFDKNGLEIQYPAALSSSPDIEDQGGSINALKCPKLKVVEYDANLGMHKRKCDGADPPLARKYPRNVEKGGKFGQIGSVDERIETDHTIISKGTIAREIIRNTEGRIQCVIQGRRYNDTTSEEAIARAKAFKVEEPMCIIAMRPSYIGDQYNIYTPPKCSLLFPACFVEEYFDSSNRYTTLRSIDGRTWSVEYRLEAGKPKRCFFTYGWRRFVIDNNFKTGDVCLFELIKGVENALKVIIFRSIYQDKAPKLP